MTTEPTESTTEATTEDAAQDMSDLEAGYNDDDSTALPPSDDDSDLKPPARQDIKPAEAPTAPEYVQLTRQEVDELKARAALIDEIKTTQDRSFGKFGGTIRTIEERIDALTKGKRIEIEQGEIDELRKDGFEAHAKALEKLKDLQVIAGASPEDIAKTVNERVTEQVGHFKQQMESRLLRKVHPDWEEYQTNAEFERWVVAQPEAYRQKLVKASQEWDSDVIADAMTKAKDAAKAAAEAAAKHPTTQRQPQRQQPNRAAVLEAAVQPRGTGRPASSGSRTAHDEFAAGFNED